MRTFLAWAFVLPMAVLVTELPSQAIADDVGVDGVPAFWFDYVEPRPDDDVRVCDLEKWESWRNSGNYSVMQTYYTVCRDGLRQLKRVRIW
jgi:alpha-glucosidase (family GH31 glycosyl hydrolase)